MSFVGGLSRVLFGAGALVLLGGCGTEPTGEDMREANQSAAAVAESERDARRTTMEANREARLVDLLEELRKGEFDEDVGSEVHCVDDDCWQQTANIVSSASLEQRQGEVELRGSVSLQATRLAEQPTTPREVLFAAAREADGDYVSVSVELAELPASYAELARVRSDDRERAAWIEARKDQVRPAQEAFRRFVEELGGRWEGELWIANTVHVAIPRRSIEKFLEWNGIVMVHPAGEPGSTGFADGWERQQELGAINTTHQGESGGSHGGNIVVAIVECDDEDDGSINTSHFGWLDWAGSSSRIIDTDHCRLRGTQRKCKDTASGSHSTHPTYVASVLAGSIEQGQDTNFPGTDTVS